MIWKELTSIWSNMNNFSLTWSCGSRQRDTTSSEWKFKLDNLAAKGLIWLAILMNGFNAAPFFEEIWNLFCDCLLRISDTKRFTNVGLMLVLRRRRLATTKLALIQRIVLTCDTPRFYYTAVQDQKTFGFVEYIKYLSRLVFFLLVRLNIPTITH